MGKSLAASALIFLLLGCGSVPGNAQTDVAELSFWESVRDSKAPEELEAYLKVYPDGHFAPLALLRIERLKDGDASKAAQSEQTSSSGAGTKAQPRWQKNPQMNRVIVGVPWWKGSAPDLEYLEDFEDLSDLDKLD